MRQKLRRGIQQITTPYDNMRYVAALRFLLAGRKWALIRALRHFRPRRFQWKSVAFGAELRRIHEESIAVYDENPLSGISSERAESIFARSPGWKLRDDRIDELSGDIYIEPTHSIALLPGRRIFEATRYVHRNIEPRRDRPAVSDKVLRVPGLIHFDGFYGKNLWHFYCEVLGSFLMLRETRLVDPKLPVLIHRQVWERPHVRYVLSHPRLREVRWLIQEFGQWIATEKIFKSYSGRDGLVRVRQMIGWQEPFRPFRKIFLDRKARRLTNAEKVQRCLEDCGFQTVFAEDLSYEEQVRLFSETRCLVALHGAGITNILYSSNSLKLIEILPAGFANAHYYWLSRTLGLAYYDAVIGTEIDWRGDFTVDPKAFQEALKRMMVSEDPQYAAESISEGVRPS